MIEKEINIEALIAENKELKNQLFEAKNLIQAVKEGAIDALVVNKEGRVNIYTLESADYTYRVLIEKCGEGALSISESGIILFCNEYFSKIINVPTHKLIGTYFMSYVESIGKFNELKTNLSNGLSKGEIILNINGKKIPVYLSLTNLQPNLPAIGIIVTDLSEKKAHDEKIAQYQNKLESKITELNQTNAKLEQFIYVISNDFHESVRKIVIYSDLEEKSLSSERENIKVIHDSAQRLNSIVDTFTKQSLIASKFMLVNVDLNIILKEVIEDLELLIKENYVQVIVKSLPIVRGSTVQLRLLFSNIIRTLLKDKNNKVEIRFDSEINDCIDINFPNKKFYKIRIANEGHANKRRRLKSTTKEYTEIFSSKYCENETGLNICKKIMENHFGVIKFQNLLGEETVFNLYFPV